MRNALRVLRSGALILSTIICSCGCTTPESRVKQMPGETVAKVHTVIIQQMKFTPAELTVRAGDTVRWLNRDMLEHNVTEEANKEWSSQALPPGKSWKIVVSKSSTYLCTIHPVMKGSITVK